MRLHLGSHLSWYVAGKPTQLEIRLQEPVALAALAAQLGLPSAEIAVAAVNGRLVRLEEARVSDGDRVELHPAVGGG